MKLSKTVSNPMLVGAIELMKAEDTPDHRKMFVDELMKASLLAPVLVTPAPELDESGMMHMQPGSQVQFPMLSAPDGKTFFMAYTDRMELKKWKDEEDQQTFSLKFDDFAGMLLKKDAQGGENPAAGFVINPFGGNVIITKEMVASIIAARMAQAQGKRPGNSE